MTTDGNVHPKDTVTDRRARLMVAALGFLRLEGQRPAVREQQESVQ